LFVIIGIIILIVAGIVIVIRVTREGPTEEEGSYYEECAQLVENLGLQESITFTGDVNFSESEVVDRLIEIFGDVKIIPGISSIQVAAAKARVPIDKSKVITMHVTTSIEEKKTELLKALLDGISVILVPRPWPKDPQKHFMPSEIAVYLQENGFDGSKLKVWVFESLTNSNETIFVGTINELIGKSFSDLSVMVFNQTDLESYLNFPADHYYQHQ